MLIPPSTSCTTSFPEVRNFKWFLQVNWVVWKNLNGVWVLEIRGVRIAFSALGELLQSVLVLIWRCTVERYLDSFLGFQGDRRRKVHWLV